MGRYLRTSGLGPATGGGLWWSIDVSSFGDKRTSPSPSPRSHSKPGTGNEQPSSLQPTSITPSLLILDHIPTKIRVYCCCSRYLRYPFCVCLGFSGSSFTRSTRNLTHSHFLYYFLRILYIVRDDLSSTLARSLLPLFSYFRRSTVSSTNYLLGRGYTSRLPRLILILDSIKPLARSATVPHLLALLPRNCNFIVSILSLASLTTNSVSHAGFSSRPVTSLLLRTRAPTSSRSPSPVNVVLALRRTLDLCVLSRAGTSALGFSKSFGCPVRLCPLVSPNNQNHLFLS